MAVLPGYDTLEALGVYSHGSLVWMAFVQYLVSILFFCILVLACCNFYLIFIKQKKYKNSTLLTFYLLTIAAMIIRILTLLTFW